MASSSSWTQVYLRGLPKSLDPNDAEIEDLLNERFGLSSEQDLSWAGPGTTVVKRDNEEGLCRGFAFLSFHSQEGAAAFVHKVNIMPTSSFSPFMDQKLPWHDLEAELSQPKGGKKGNQTKKKHQQRQSQENLSDLRLRSRRSKPIRKHPVIVSSNGKKTNLGNKTR